LNQDNDTSSTVVNLKFGDVFAYDNANNPQNDMPEKQFSGVSGKGLSLHGNSFAGYGKINGYSSFIMQDYASTPLEQTNSSGPGSIAMKFSLNQPDTVYGYKAYFGDNSTTYDDISFALYKDINNPGTEIQNSKMFKFRGYDDQRKKYLWNEYITYLLPKPIVLQPGNYWLGISQLSSNPLNLGASKSRMGMRTTNINVELPFHSVKEVGKFGNSLMIDKRFRRLNHSDKLINDNKFAYENKVGSGSWKQFMPTQGNPAYPHLHHFGLNPNDNFTLSLSQGTWIPMLRPYLGNKYYGSSRYYEDCSDYYDDFIPVELIGFNGISRSGRIELIWTTVSEYNNSGFYIDKKFELDEDWKTITFVNGNGTTNRQINYNYTDNAVESGKVYNYRIRQSDKDGTVVCESDAPVISVLQNGNIELQLEQNSPNPALQYTIIKYQVPDMNLAELEIVDIFGRIIRTFGSDGSGEFSINWDLTDNQGKTVPSGIYICRLRSGDETMTRTITVIK
jgi:hypothetical protein